MTKIESKYLIVGAGVLAFITYILGARQVFSGIKNKMCTDPNYVQTSNLLQSQCPNISPLTMVNYYYVPTIPIVGDFTKGFIAGTLK